MASPTYGAFISYRRGGADETVARLLHRLLERYRTPRRLVRTGIASRIGQVFLDTAEREAAPDLDQAIRSALDASRWLIVVCSRRAPRSRWMAQEISHFAADRRDRILPLLIDGEPESSYPRPLREGIEPKAADIRSPTRAAALAKLRRNEKLALLAPMLGVRFDDLERREVQRKRRRAATLASLLGVVLAGFAVLLVMMRAERQRRELFEVLDGVEAAMALDDHPRAAELAHRAIALDRAQGLDRGHETERVVRATFDLPFFRRALASVPRATHAIAGSDLTGTIACATDEDLIVVERQGGGAASRALDTQNEEVTTLAYRPGTAELSAGTAAGIVLRFAAGRVDRFELGFGRIHQMVFSPDGHRLAAASEDGLFVRDTTAAADRPFERVGDATLVASAAFSADGDWLAAAVGDAIAVWQLSARSRASPRHRLSLPAGDEGLHLEIDPASFRLVATGYSFDLRRGPRSTILLWPDLRQTEARQTVMSNEDISLRARFADTGELLVFGAQTPLRIVGLGGRVWAPAGAPAASTLARGRHAGEVIMVDPETGDLVALDFAPRALAPVVLPAVAPVRDVAFVGTDGLTVAAAYDERSAPVVWRLATLVPTRASLVGPRATWSLEGTTLTRLAASPQRPDRLAGVLDTPHEHQRLLVWDPHRKEAAASPLAHPEEPRDIAFGASGQLLATVGFIEPRVELHDFRTGETEGFDVATTAPLIAVAIDADGTATHLAIGDQDGRVFVLDADDGTAIDLVGRADRTLTALRLAFSSDGRWLAVAGDHGVRVLDRAKRGQPRDLEPRAAAVDVAFSGDGAALFAAMNDGRVLRWSTEHPDSAAFVLSPPGVAAMAIAVSGDDRRLAAGFADGTVRVWPRFAATVAYLRDAVEP